MAENAPTRLLPVITDTMARPTTFIPHLYVQQGWAWVVCLLSAMMGLLTLAVADLASRFSSGAAYPLFWLGLVLIYLPSAWRMMQPHINRAERLALGVGVGMSLYIVKVLEYPIYFTFYDEFLHWRTAQDIAATQHLFTSNSLLPISPLYPGLELVTNALSSISGLPIFIAGIIVVAAARLVLILALFLFFEHLSQSAYVAGIAVLIYCTNPHFLFFDAQYGYESLAMPCLILVIYCITQSFHTVKRERFGYLVLAWMALLAMVLTHHVTSFLLFVMLLIWAVMTVILRKDRVERVMLALTTLITIELIIFWLLYVGTLVLAYLSPYIFASAQEAVKLVARNENVRPLFTDASGQVAPLWERLTGTGAVVLMLAVLPFALWAIWRQHRRHAVIMTLAVIALAYPAVVALRLTSVGAELSTRLATFLFIAVAFVLALGIVTFKPPRIPQQWVISATVAGLLFVFIGGVISGGGPTWARLPGPYLISADMRSIDPEGIDSALWTGTYLGPNQRVAADHINQLLMGTYGHQRVITEINDFIQDSHLYYSTTLDPFDISILQKADIHFLVVDERLATGLPHIGEYYDTGDQHTDTSIAIPSTAALMKFDQLALVNRIYDSGDIKIYDMGAFLNAG